MTQNELVQKVSDFIQREYGGDYRVAFAMNDVDKDGRFDGTEVDAVLKMAGIGNWLTRQAWVRGILTKLDTDNDGKISLAEFESIFNKPQGEVQ